MKNLIQNEIDDLEKVTGQVNLRFSPEIENALDDASKYARALKDELISVEHLMLGIMEKSKSGLKQILKSNEEYKNVLKSEGLLTRDARVKERKKYGRKRARKRFQFSKR